MLFDPLYTAEIDGQFDLGVIDLIVEMKPYWSSNDPYPGDPYGHDQFRKYFSDHHPVVFRMVMPAADDD